MKELTFIENLIARMQSTSPVFWKKLQKFGVYGALLVACVLMLNEFDVITLNVHVANLLKAIDGLFAGVFVAAKAGTTDPTLVDDQTKRNIAEEVLKK